VGSVGPKLLLADFTIQSAGHWHGDTPEHLGRGRDRNEPGPWATLQIARECSSLSGSCLGVRRDVYERVGGMNRTLPNAYNDADFGTKLRAVGLRNVWIPWVEMFHFEFSSRDPSVETSDLVTYRERWCGQLRREVYSPDGAW
jgi:GT2 family glycosyltransferase